MFYVYILESLVNGSFYVGETKNLEDRLKRHNEGRSRFTSSKVPWKLVYFEEYKTRSEAMKREREIKNKKSRRFIEDLFKRKYHTGP